MAEIPREILNKSFDTLKRQTDYWAIDFSAVAAIRECLVLSAQSGSVAPAAAAVGHALSSLLSFCIEATDADRFTCRFCALSAVVTALLSEAAVGAAMADQVAEKLTDVCKSEFSGNKRGSASVIVRMHIQSWVEIAKTSTSLKELRDLAGDRMKLPKHASVDISWVDLWSKVYSTVSGAAGDEMFSTLMSSSVRLICRGKELKKVMSYFNVKSATHKIIYQYLVSSLLGLWSACLDPLVVELEGLMQKRDGSKIGELLRSKPDKSAPIALRLHIVETLLGGLKVSLAAGSLEASMMVWLANSAPPAWKLLPILLMVCIALQKSESFRASPWRKILQIAFEENMVELEPISKALKGTVEGSWESSLSHQLKVSTLLLATDAQLLQNVSAKFPSATGPLLALPEHLSQQAQLRALTDELKAQLISNQQLLERFKQIRQDQLKAETATDEKVEFTALPERTTINSDDTPVDQISRRLKSTMDQLDRAFVSLRG